MITKVSVPYCVFYLKCKMLIVLLLVIIIEHIFNWANKAVWPPQVWFLSWRLVAAMTSGFSVTGSVRKDFGENIHRQEIHYSLKLSKNSHQVFKLQSFPLFGVHLLSIISSSPHNHKWTAIYAHMRESVHPHEDTQHQKTRSSGWISLICCQIYKI